MEKPKLIVELDPQTGAVTVNGPINDQIFCFGMLELAKEAIRTHAKEQNQRILVARPKIVGAVS